ncbi:MAG: hypothetical protein ABIH23_29585, partial [bacterium]
YYMTGDEKYLEPIRSMAEIRRRYLQERPTEDPPEGSEAWCAAKINLSSVLGKYRFLAGDTEFDDLLGGGGDPYFLFRFRGDRGPLVEVLEGNAQAFGVNFPGYTSEVRYTDRVLRFPALFRDGVLYSKGIDSIHVPNPGLLYSTATGDPGGVGYFPLNRVKWLTPPRKIAALVTDTARDRFRAELFHFGEEPRKMGAELYLFDPGEYMYRIEEGERQNTNKQEGNKFKVTGPRTRISFDLPPRRLVTLTIEPL